MTLAIIGLLVALAPAIVSLVQWLLKREAKKPLTAAEQHTKNEQDIAKAIATGDERSVNLHVDDMLNKLRKSDEVRGNQRGQGDKES